MTPAGDTARNLALALDAFLAEHRGSRFHGERQSGEDHTARWLESGGCGATIAFRIKFSGD
jgi:hypothetical protein